MPPSRIELAQFGTRFGSCAACRDAHGSLHESLVLATFRHLPVQTEPGVPIEGRTDIPFASGRSTLNPLRRFRRDIHAATSAGPCPDCAADHWAESLQTSHLFLPVTPSAFVAVPPDDLGEDCLDVALDLAAFYNTLRQGEIADEHALVLTQAFFPGGRRF